jgi:phosphatidate cytidylyltransferase
MKWFAILSPVQWTLVGIFLILIVATACVACLRRFKPNFDVTELRDRIRTWWVMVSIFTLAMVSSRTISLVFFALVSFLALREYLSLIPARPVDRRVFWWAYLAIPLQYYWVYVEWYGVFIIFIPMYCFLFLQVRMVLLGHNDGYLRAAGTLHWGLMMTVFNLSHAAFLLILRDKTNPTIAAGPGLMLYLVSLTQLNDVAQYIWGRALGRRKIVPAISPNKTWGGFLGGVGTTTLCAYLVGPILTPMNGFQSLVAGLIISAGGFLGDVTLSALKRDIGVKDTSNLLPGHGGILDRVDSLTYTAPLLFHYIYYLFTWHTFGTRGGFGL